MINLFGIQIPVYQRRVACCYGATYIDQVSIFKIRKIKKICTDGGCGVSFSKSDGAIVCKFHDKISQQKMREIIESLRELGLNGTHLLNYTSNKGLIYEPKLFITKRIFKPNYGYEWGWF